MKKKQRCLLKRFSALVSAMVISFSFSVPAFAAGNNWPSSPAASVFQSHPKSWYVWQRKSLSGVNGYELICHPMREYNSSNSSYVSMKSYSTNSSTYSYTNSSGTITTFMYGLPYIPTAEYGFFSDLPSFPVASPTAWTAAVRLYPVIWRDYLHDIDDVFSDRSLYGFLTSWPSSGDSSIADKYEHEIFDTYPVYIPSNIFFFGSKTDTSTNHTSFSVSGGDNDFWSTPFNDEFLDISLSHFSNSSMTSFPVNSTIPSSDIGFVFCKRPAGAGMHVYNSQFDVTLSFMATLWVPDALLPSNVAVGDWISQGTMDKLQDQLVKDFDVDSDTLTNSKDNLNSWNSTSSVDSDVASGAIGLLNGIFQNLGTFLFSVSLLCFGAVVLRMLIRKAVDG